MLTDEERRELWVKKIGNQLKITRELYHGLISRLETHPFPKKAAKIIQDDLDRTFPNCRTFYEGERMYRNMERILRLFQVYRPDYGYVQGMTYLLSIIYYYFDEFESFKIFANLVITNKFLKSMYNFDLSQVIPRPLVTSDKSLSKDF